MSLFENHHVSTVFAKGGPPTPPPRFLKPVQACFKADGPQHLSLFESHHASTVFAGDVLGVAPFFGFMGFPLFVLIFDWKKQENLEFLLVFKPPDGENQLKLQVFLVFQLKFQKNTRENQQNQKNAPTPKTYPFSFCLKYIGNLLFSFWCYVEPLFSF